MGTIHFPEEVQIGLAFLDRISALESQCVPPIIKLAKWKSLIPTTFGPPIKKDHPANSLTTTALLAVRLPEARSFIAGFARFFKQCEREVKKKKALPSATFGPNNPITLALIARTYQYFGKTAEAPYKFAINHMLRWTRRKSIEMPWSGLPELFAGKPVEMPWSGYPALLVDDVLSKARPRSGSLLEAEIGKAREMIGEWALRGVTQQVTFFHSAHSAYFDVGELALLILLACRLKRLYWTSPITAEAVKIIFKCQAEDGLWHPTKPFWYGTDRPYFLASSQIMLAVVRILTKRPEMFSLYEKQIHTYVSWLDSNLAEAKYGGAKLYGWATGGERARDQVEMFVTLENLKVLRKFKRLVKQLNRQNLLQSSGLTVKWQTTKWSDLLPIDSSKPPKERLEATLTKIFVQPYKTKHKLSRCAMVLYGPPGTSKTTIAEALASALTAVHQKPWPLITVTPGDFIAGGEQMAEINAANIFRTLMELPDVVILFDEIDELLKDRRRGKGHGGALQFMTTSMLTKLQALRQKSHSVFILTTNHFETLDIAVRRAGRFDCHLGIMPPDRKSRVQMLAHLIKKFDSEEKSDFAGKLKTRDFYEIATHTCLFTFPELMTMTFDVLQDLKKDAEKHVIQKKLLDFTKTYAKATSLNSYTSRENADKETTDLIRIITKAEHVELSDAEKESLAVLARRLKQKEPKFRVPRWITSYRGSVTASKAAKSGH